MVIEGGTCCFGALGAWLWDADARHRDLLEQMWRRNCRGRIARELCQELGVGEGRAEMGCRFPNSVVQVGRVLADGAMKLRGNEARLTFHESGIIFPNFEEALLIGFVDR